jgi:gamma-glutamylcyclotransferase (GGCT)/AIG2-like uncharacterized protein YtfP
MNQKLFVYGTLGLGRPNEHILKKIGGSFEKASVIGILHNVGWGADMGYHGLTIDTEGEKIEGYLFSSDNLNKHWSELDGFEGDAYERLLTKVKLKNGTTVKAFVYTIKRINNS